MEKKPKKARKLTLAKETLRLLERQELEKAAGGVAGTQTCANSGCRSCYTCFCP